MNIKERVCNSIEMKKLFELISKEITLSSYKSKNQNDPLYNSFRHSKPPKRIEKKYDTRY